MPTSFTYLSAVIAFGGVLVATPFASAAADNLTAGQVRDQFVHCGYRLGNSPTTTTSRYIVIRDSLGADRRYTDSRIAMAIVYADSETAQAAHLKTHRQAEDSLGERWPYSDDHGPQLLAGYGASVWRANVAIVQSSLRTLASIYTSDEQTGETRVARPEMLELGFVNDLAHYGVDWDLVTCLDGGLTASIGAPGGLPPQAIVMPGRRW